MPASRAFVVVVAALVLVSGPVVGLELGPPAVLLEILNPTVVAVGPEDPEPASYGDGCVVAAAAQNPTVRRVCFDDAKSPTLQETAFTLPGGSSVLGLAFDPTSDPDARIDLYVAWSPGPEHPFASHVARARSLDGGSTWDLDPLFLSGLPRSSFDHQINGLAMGPDRCLVIAQGGNSNLGFDRDFPESRLSGAILRACFLTGDGEVDPTFDHVCGSELGEEPCDVELLAPGFRNPYDLAWHSDGSLYATDNDADPGYREHCDDPADTFGCPCQTVGIDPGGDELNRIRPGRTYGFPNPYRAHPPPTCSGSGCEGDPAQCFAFSTEEPPSPEEDPSGRYEPPILEREDGGRLQGLVEMRGAFASLFPGSLCSDWDGDLLAGGIGDLRRLESTSAGFVDAGSFGGAARGLDLDVGPDGTVYVADFFGGEIVAHPPVLDPAGDGEEFATFCDAGQAAESWEDAAQLPFHMRETTAAAVELDSGWFLYLLGHRSGASLRFDLATGEWSTSLEAGEPGPPPAPPHPLPSSRSSDHRAAVAVGTSIFVVGGFGPVASEVWEVDGTGVDAPVARRPIGCADGTPVEPCPEALAVGSVSLAEIEGDLYLAGGLCDADDPECFCREGACPPGMSDRVFRYHRGADRWVELAPMPLAVDHAAAAAWGGEMWVVGGRRCGENLPCPGVVTTQVYDPRSDSWRFGPDLAEPCGGLGGRAIVLDDRLLVFGGEGEGCSGDAVQELDPRTGLWSIVARLPDTHHGNPPVRIGTPRDAVPDRVHLAGGLPESRHHHVLQRDCEECALRVVAPFGSIPLFRDGFESGDAGSWSLP